MHCHFSLLQGRKHGEDAKQQTPGEVRLEFGLKHSAWVRALPVKNAYRGCQGVA